MLKYLLQKEFLQIRRNSFMPKIIFIFPIMVMCVMPWVMNQEVKNIRVDVVDIDRTMQSQQLVHQIEASNYFIFNGQKATYQEVGKYSAVTLIAAGKLPASPSASTMRHARKSHTEMPAIAAAVALPACTARSASTEFTSFTNQHVAMPQPA